MGLDWTPLSKPRPGHEAEFQRLFKELKEAKEGDPRIARFQEISQPPYELLGAPRVGFDNSANDWLREKLKENNQLREFNQIAKEMKGYYVLELLPDCDGFPIYTHAGLYEGVDRCSFRAEFLKDVQDVLGQELLERAWSSMLADDLKQYGQELLGVAERFATPRDLSWTKDARDVEFEEESDGTRAHILFAAAKWCLYWAGRGHGLEVFY